MNLDEYYKQVLSGCELFEAKEGVVFYFERWVSTVNNWLQKLGTDPGIVFDWYALNEVSEFSTSEILPKPEKLKSYLIAVSERFEWLAKLPGECLPTADENLLKSIKLKIKSLGENPEKLIEMGFKLTNFSDYHLAHQNFHSWLINISQYLQKLAPDSGLSSEWLSLPAITFYISGALLGGGDKEDELRRCIQIRNSWLGKIFGVDITDKADANLSKRKVRNVIRLDPILVELNGNGKQKERSSINCHQKDSLNINEIIKDKEWLTIDELSIYIGYEKKTIYNWTSKCKIPFKKPQGNLMFNRKEIDLWIKEGGLILRKRK